MSNFKKLEDLRVYQRLCRLHLEICAMAKKWPAEEKFELGSQIRRSSNSAPAQLAEKHDDRHIRNKIEGVNRSRGEAAETIHHLYIAYLKGYETRETYEHHRAHYQECIRMLNGMERTLERYLPEKERRWPELREQDPELKIQEDSCEYGPALSSASDLSPPGYPEPDVLESLSLTPEPES